MFQPPTKSGAPPKGKSAYADMFGDETPPAAEPGAGTPNTLQEPHSIEGYFDGSDAVLSAEDKALVEKITPPQALVAILQEHNKGLAEAVIGKSSGCTVKEVRGFLQATYSTLAVLDPGYVITDFVAIDGLNEIPRRVLDAVLRARHTTNELLVLPSGVVNYSVSALAAFSSQRFIKVPEGLKLVIDGHGEVLLPTRANTTDASNARLVSLLSFLTKREHVTVPLQVEQFLRVILALAPMRLVPTHGKGSRFEEIPKSKELEDFRKEYVPSVFQVKGELRVKISEAIADIKHRLNATPVPPGVETNVLLQACWQLHRIGSSLAEPVTEIAEVFFRRFSKDIKAVETLIQSRYEILREWPYGSVAAQGILPEKEVVFTLPLTALQRLYSDRRIRTGCVIDAACDHTTQNNPFANKALGVTTKIMACRKAVDIPPGTTKMAVFGVHKGYDKNLWPAATEFYDLKPQAIDGISVRQLDVNDAQALKNALAGKRAVFSDVCPEIPGSIDIKKLSDQCSFAKNRTLLANMCNAVVATDSIEWFALKMFLPYASATEIPDFLVPLMTKFGYTIVKSGKAHNDEFYIVFSTAATKRGWGYWKYSLIRIAHWIIFGNEAAMRLAAVGNLRVFPLPEAQDGWGKLEGGHFPFTMGKGSGYKDMSVDDYAKNLRSLWAHEDVPFQSHEAPTPGEEATALHPPAAAPVGTPVGVTTAGPAEIVTGTATSAALAAASGRTYGKPVIPTPEGGAEGGNPGKSPPGAQE